MTRPHSTPTVRPDELVGATLSALSTPALLLRLDLLERNITTLAAWAEGRVSLRPHTKVHKSPQIARLQIEAGAIGVTAATVSEAVAMIDAGIPSVLVANEIAERAKADVLARAAEEASIWVAIDGFSGAELLASAARARDVTFNVLIEVDIGMTRGGVRSINQSTELAHMAAALSGIRLRGVMGWEGHVATITDHDDRKAKAATAVEFLLDAFAAVQAVVPDVDTVSSGGTNTYDMTGATVGVTEIQPGTYALMDTSYHSMAPAFEPALSVLGTVISTHGTRAVVNCGSKVHALTELAPPRVRNESWTVDEVHEEHALLTLPSPATCRVGDKVEIVTSYCSGTVNLHDFFFVCQGDEVVDVWPIAERGAGSIWRS